MTHICVGNLTIIGSDNGLSPGRRQAIIWTNAGILLIGPLGTNFSEIVIEIHTFSFKKIHLKMSSGKWRPFCLGLNVLNVSIFTLIIDFVERNTKPLQHIWLKHRSSSYIWRTNFTPLSCAVVEFVTDDDMFLYGYLKIIGTGMMH